MIKASFKQVNIDPPIGMSLAGTRIERISVGIRDSLKAKVCILKFSSIQNNILIIISCDLLGVSQKIVSSIKNKIQKRHNIPAENILVCATHTHTGPATVEIFDSELNQNYIKNLKEKISGAVNSGFHDLSEGTLVYNNGIESDIIFNRRVILNDGRTVISGLEDIDLQDIKCIEGPVDPQIHVLGFKNKNDDFEGIIYNYACHPDIVTGLRYSADFPYYVQKTTNKILEKDIPVIFLNGTSGNINNHDIYKPDVVKTRSRYFDENGLSKCKNFSKKLGSQIINIALKAEKINFLEDLSCKAKKVAINLRNISDDQLKKAKKVLRKNHKNLTEKDKTAAKEVVRLYKLKDEKGHIEIEIQVFNFGRLAFVALPLEVFVEIGLHIKEKSPFNNTFIVTLANGYEGYLPTEKAFKNGGYEVKPAFSSKLCKKAESELKEKILTLLQNNYKNK